MAKEGFAVWITGLPASGKSTLAAALSRALEDLGVEAAILESDALRKVFTPNPRYDDEEREVFYASMAHVGRILTRHGVPVIFDATANRRAYRDRAREAIPKFLEVHVSCPLAVCVARDPKGIYRKGSRGEAGRVPGLQVDYEPPLRPDVEIPGDREAPDEGARRVIAALRDKGYLATPRRRRGGEPR
ncbi:MAG: adenylyl-sulfate kinase [Gemmatimonadota bacterium]